MARRTEPDSRHAAAIISDAGGRLVGRTRLQKTAYLLELVGLGSGFDFAYRHFGPYCDSLALAARSARSSKQIIEKEHDLGNGGSYSIYSIPKNQRIEPRAERRDFVALATGANAVVLELAATAAFLAKEGETDPWAETARRKPVKADGGRLDDAKELYSKLLALETPRALPKIV